MKVYIKFIITTYLKSFINILLLIFALVLILNLLTEIEFFSNREINVFYMLYISFLNSPSLVFEMLPFIFLVSTQAFFIHLFKDEQIQTFKYSGLKNSSILKIFFKLRGIDIISNIDSLKNYSMNSLAGICNVKIQSGLQNKILD